MVVPPDPSLGLCRGRAHPWQLVLEESLVLGSFWKHKCLQLHVSWTHGFQPFWAEAAPGWAPLLS